MTQYDLPRVNRSDPRGKEGKIRDAAKKYGIDPEIALKVARSEGLASFKSGVRRKDGSEEPSFGAFQLYTGGGLGNKFQKETGLDPADPKNEDATIDFALREASRGGWTPWHGAAKVGVGQWDGISGKGGAPPAPSAYGYASQAPTPAEGTPIKQDPLPDTQTASPTPPAGPSGDFLTSLQAGAKKDPGALSDIVKGLGGAFTGAGTAMPAQVAQPITPIPVATPTQTQVVPTVDPQVINNQRQQLAAAMQRLNSGRLY